MKPRRRTQTTFSPLHTSLVLRVRDTLSIRRLLFSKWFKQSLILSLTFAAGLSTKDLFDSSNVLFPPATITAKKETKGQEIACSVCFTPYQECLPLIINEINNAKQTVHVQANNLTSNLIASALLRAKTRGISIVILMDKNQHEQQLQIQSLKALGVTVLFNHRPVLAHNKIILIDGETVINESSSFSPSIEPHNEENVLIIKNKELADFYQANFDRRIKASAPLV